MDNAQIVEALLASEDAYFRALGSLASIKLERGKQYNQGTVKLEDYFPLGRASYIQMAWVKTQRAVSQCQKLAREPITIEQRCNPEFADSVLDLANYAIFALMAEEEKPK
jgi:hypothetical protein